MPFLQLMTVLYGCRTVLVLAQLFMTLAWTVLYTIYSLKLYLHALMQQCLFIFLTVVTYDRKSVCNINSKAFIFGNILTGTNGDCLAQTLDLGIMGRVLYHNATAAGLVKNRTLLVIDILQSYLF
jgi:hypothetical protein